MQVNMAGLRRNIVNLAHNYSDAQVKVREATSNDPWGPSSTIMSEIADLTYNVVAFTEIMQMIWKRLNDHGRNWRHVYKALVLLEYLIKTGTEKVAQQCKENIFAIQTLKDFQYFEGTKDQGLNVREKAKQLVQLLKDDERLRNERARALKAKERFAQAASGFGSDGSEAMSPPSPSFPSFQTQWPSSCESDTTSRELETARPQTVGEEELQLQLALAMSREEAEQEEQRRRSDDVRLQLALSQSEEEFKSQRHHQNNHMEKSSHILDLLDVNLESMEQRSKMIGLVEGGAGAVATPSPIPTPAASAVSPTVGVLPSTSASLQRPRVVDPWGFPQAVAIETTAVTAQNDPWSSTASVPVSAPVVSPIPSADPWTPVSQEITTKPGGTLSPDVFDLTVLNDSLSDKSPAKKTPHSFLGENSSLVNLDNLVARPASASPSTVSTVPLASANPFTGGVSVPQSTLFPQTQGSCPSINQIRQQSFGSPGIPVSDSAWGGTSTAPHRPPVLPTPLLPSNQPNPFLS